MAGHLKGLTALGAAVSLALTGCGNEQVIDDRCFVDQAPITPRSTTLNVGDTVTFQATLGPAECLPAGVEPPDWRWYSQDTLVATIDSLSGLATAVGLGLGPIRVEHARERSVQSSAILRVLAAGQAVRRYNKSTSSRTQ